MSGSVKSVDGKFELSVNTNGIEDEGRLRISPDLREGETAEFGVLDISLPNLGDVPREILLSAMDLADKVIDYNWKDCYTCYERPNGTTYCKRIC